MIKQLGQFLLPKRFHSIGAGIYWFGFRYQCCICRSRLRKLRPVACEPDFDDMCVRCGSLGRHRFIWLYLNNQTNLFRAPVNVLHFAAERCFSERLKNFENISYTTADVAEGYMEVLNLMDIHKSDATYDVVLCIHVLEHVEDDARAMSEIFRVLKPGGWAILNPHMDLSLERTLEDPTVTSPEERRRLFNQEDHYRVYGRDLKDRLAKVGFDVEIVPYMEEIPVSLQKRYSLRTPGIIVLCKKPELPRDTRAVVRPTAFSEQTFAGRLPADSPPAMSVSVLIPCFNAERWVGEAIESALRQTWPEKEVIVVDDGSQDGSLRVIESFGSRIRWETGPNRGGNVARNRLLELAQGEWLQYLDADDYLLPLKIERQLGFLREHPTCDVVYSPTLWVNWSEAGTTQEVTAIREPHDPWILLGRWWLPQTGGPLWRRQALIDVRGWKPNQPCCQEHELYLRLLQAGAEFRYFGECHAAYRHWSQNATVSKHSRAELRRRRLEIEERMEQFLESRGELTPARMQALNQARFELARGAWLEDPAEATKIVGAIKERQPGFVPEPPAARGQYRWLYQTFGFTAAERAAAYKRRLSGTAGRFWPGPNVAPLPLDEK